MNTIIYITLTDELQQLLQAITDSPQDSPERDRAKQALGQYIYRAYDDQLDDDSWMSGDDPDDHINYNPPIGNYDAPDGES